MVASSSWSMTTKSLVLYISCRIAACMAELNYGSCMQAIVKIIQDSVTHSRSQPLVFEFGDHCDSLPDMLSPLELGKTQICLHLSNSGSQRGDLGGGFHRVASYCCLACNSWSSDKTIDIASDPCSIWRWRGGGLSLEPCKEWEIIHPRSQSQTQRREMAREGHLYAAKLSEQAERCVGSGRGDDAG